MSLALSSLGVGRTEQRCPSNQRGWWDHFRGGRKFCLLFWNAKQRHPNGMRGFCSSPYLHCAEASRHQPSSLSPKGKRQIDGQWSRSLNRPAGSTRWNALPVVVKLQEIRATCPRIRNLGQAVHPKSTDRGGLRGPVRWHSGGLNYRFSSGLICRGSLNGQRIGQ